ncbi:MAG: heme biosynthesis HemY N-terminal domain-containing protein [Granulosicoccaceae bacterium]
MRTFLLVLFLIALAILTFVFLHQDAGSVQVNFQGNSFAAPLVYVFYGILAAFLALYVLFRIVGMLFRAPSALGKAKERRSTDAAAQRLVSGSLDLAEGQYARAEKQLTKDVPHGATGVLHYLAAAEAAEAQDRPEYYERYLKLAGEHHQGAKFGIDLGRAQKALDEGDSDKALETARGLVKVQSHNPRAKGLLGLALAATANWEELNVLLPDLRKNSSLNKTQVADLEAKSSTALLAEAEDEKLESRWKSLAPEARTQPSLLSSYARRLQATGKGELAERTLRTALDSNFDPALVASYGAVDGANAEQQLNQLQSWIEKHGESSELLAAAGQISVRQELWGKAHSYMEQAAKLGDSAAIQQALAQIANNKGDTEASRGHLERGLGLALKG